MTLTKINSSRPNLLTSLISDQCSSVVRIVSLGSVEKFSLVLNTTKDCFRRLGRESLGHFARPYGCGLRSDSLPGPCVQIVLGIQSDSTGQRYQRKRKEEAEDYVYSNQSSIGCGDESAEEHLAPRHARTRSWIRDHIKGEQDKSYARHGQQRGSERSAKSQITKQRLQEETAYPSNGDTDSLGELNIQKAAAHDNDGGQNPASPSVNVFSEMIWRRNAYPRKEKQCETDAEIRRIQKVTLAILHRYAYERLRTN